MSIRIIPSGPAISLSGIYSVGIFTMWKEFIHPLFIKNVKTKNENHEYPSIKYWLILSW